MATMLVLRVRLWLEDTKSTTFFSILLKRMSATRKALPHLYVQ